MSSSNPSNPPSNPSNQEKRPSIRLNLSSPPIKKPRPTFYTNVSVPLHTAQAQDLTVIHQVSHIHACYSSEKWFAQGRTTLFVTDDTIAAKSSGTCELALHARYVDIQHMTVHALNAKASALEPLRVSYHAPDPLAVVLTQPPATVSQEGPPRMQADTQSSRGIAGMTVSLRAASMASVLGECRITIETPLKATANKNSEQVWQRQLESILSQEGSVVNEFETNTNCAPLAQRLAAASQALQITIHYRIPCHPNHAGGWHCVAGPNPHIYTTAGVFGDSEGPRCWLPCLDSASVHHRATHQLLVKVTAPASEGLSVVGAGTKYGQSKTMLHTTLHHNDAVTALGQNHVEWINQLESRSLTTNLIPPDHPRIHATNVWYNDTVTPIPVRALGFAIGPFDIVEDAEYFENNSEEGIRQAYFCPRSCRLWLHPQADQRLVMTPIPPLPPLGAHTVQHWKQIRTTIQAATVGIPHRALSLMRDVLGLPEFRTAAYTQIWIPHAVHGGVTCGALEDCVVTNSFLGGAIVDATLLPPLQSRLPYYQGGRVLQFWQARNAIKGWIVAAVPLGGQDDVANGYIHSLIEAFLMSLYERGHGAQGEGGAKGGTFYSKRYSAMSGLNSLNLDFLPVQNIEDLDVIGVGAVPIEEKVNDQLWRSATNGSESHTSAMDEFNIRQLLCRDSVEVLERGTDKDKEVPMPSMGWFGSHLSLTFLSSNATSSTDLGCGAVELLHPMGGLVYRTLKCEVFRGVVEARAGVANFIRLVRAAFIAGHLEDLGEKELRIPLRREKKGEKPTPSSTDRGDHVPKPPFVVCVNEILKKKGLTQTLFTRVLQNLSGPLKEAHLLGTLVDVERHAEDPRTHRPFVDPEGFPNSYVRGASLLYCRVGVQVEVAKDALSAQSASVLKGTQMQAYAEPIIPEGGIAFGGPITMRVIENEGQFREYVKDLNADGSRRDWGAAFLHAKPVTTAKAQTAASGAIESSVKDGTKSSGAGSGVNVPSLDGIAASRAFTETNFHRGGYQGIELIRLTNLTPLLWVRVDPAGMYGGRASVFQPEACLAECLFHDGDASAQVEAMRALAERPLRIQATLKVTTVYDVNVSELPVRVLADCLRGSPALHSSLPHTPGVRVQAALAIAQWQNNKAPKSKDSVGLDNWVGANLLIQYFRERFYSNGLIMPIKFSRLALRRSEAETAQAAAVAIESGAANPTHDDNYQYLDSLEEGEERAAALEEAEVVELEEDEECRVRSAVVTAIASIRAADGQTPPFVVKFLEKVLEAEDAEMVGNLVYPDEELMAEKNFRQMKADKSDEGDDDDDNDEEWTPSLSFVSGMLVADALLALFHVNVSPAMIMDPTSGKFIQASGQHPATRLLEVAGGWLEWELYREKIREEIAADDMTGIGGNCHNVIAPCAVLALAHLAIMRQCTSDASAAEEKPTGDSSPANEVNKFATAKFYVDLFDSKTLRNDMTRAACAQALACIYCAADRLEKEIATSLGLLSALEILLDRLIEESCSPSLRRTIASIMMDACTGKVCSHQRVGAIAGRNDLISSVNRWLNGPLGASHGGDNGSALLLSVSPASFPSASAVNDGARRGLRLISRAGHPKDSIDEATIVRVARFATKLWRTVNGELPEIPVGQTAEPFLGVCAYDGALRCSLLALFQWIWPRGCFSVLQVQSWKSQDNLQRYMEMGAHRVMRITEEEKEAAAGEEASLSEINRLVNLEIDRQVWRGEMVKKAYDMYKASKGSASVQDVAAAEQGLGQPLPPIQRDAAFKQGGWISSAAQQRRALALDGGTAVTKLRLTVKNSADV